MNPFQVPHGAAYGENYSFPVPSFTCLSNSSTRVLLIKSNFTLLSRALGKEPTPVVPKTEPPWKQTRFSRALLGMTLSVPSKGTLSPGSPHRTPTERHARLEILPLHVLQGP